jgi:hypothetical protein
MPRPKGRQLPHRVSVALTEDQFTVLAAMAKANGAPVSWVVRRAVVEFLAQQGLTDGQRHLAVRLINDEGTE